MSGPDSKPKSESTGQPDPLSATGMFLSGFGTQEDEPQQQAEPNIAPAPFASSAREPEYQAEPTLLFNSVQGGMKAAPPTHREEPLPHSPTLQRDVSHQPAGEFTQMFQALSAASPRAASAPPVTRPTEPAGSIIPQPSSKQAPGEFTRVFVRPVAPPPEPAADAGPNPAPFAPTPSPVKMKGFSSPGLSDSASAEGSFTQFFRSVPAAPTPAPTTAPSPTLQFQSFSSPPSSPAPAEEKTIWPSEPARAGNTPQPPASSGMTEILRALSTPLDAPSDRTSDKSQTFSAFSPAPAPPAPPANEPGSVTMLIRKLTEEDRQAAVDAPFAFQAEPQPAYPAVDSGPGEFTRIIRGDELKAGSMAAQHSDAVAAAPPPTATPQFAMPAVAPPKMESPKFAGPQVSGPQVSGAHVAGPQISGPQIAGPHVTPPHVAPPQFAPPHAAAPQFTPPKVAAPPLAPPKVAPPAAAAPKSKLQEMLPILLVLNAFLMVALIVIVIFVLRQR